MATELGTAGEPKKAKTKKSKVDLSNVGDRKKLVAQREPHWQRLMAGCFLGFRPSKGGGKGTWIARVYDEDAGKYQVKSLGDFGTLAGNEMFAAAKKQTEALAELVDAGGEIRPKIETVGDACEAYAKTRPEAGKRFERYVNGDPIAKVKLDKLRRHHLLEWRNRLEELPSLVSRSKVGEKRTRNRSPSTLNRDMTALRAALSKVLSPGAPNGDAAWQEALLAVKNADGQRTLYLDRGQRRALLEALDADIAPFVRALCLLPLRPGAMAALTAGDFDKRTAELTIGKDKNGKPRRIKVPRAAAQLLSEHVTDKLPSAPMFRRANGQSWNKDSWKLPVARAAVVAKLPDGTTAYALRHSTITDLVNAGLPLLTIAQISGTSAQMIERHYGHLTSDAALKALDGLAL